MPAPAPAAVVSDTTAQEQSLPEAASAGDSKVDDRGGSPTTEAEPAVSGALKMIEGSKIPLLVFVNSRSGGQQGKPLLAQFSSWLRPEQVAKVIVTAQRVQTLGRPESPCCRWRRCTRPLMTPLL